MLPFAFVLFGKNFYEPMGLSLSDTPIQKCRIMSDDKFLAAIVTPKGAHLREIRRSLPRLTLLDCHCLHHLTFYPAERSLVSPLGPPFLPELHTWQRLCFPVGTGRLLGALDSACSRGSVLLSEQRHDPAEIESARSRRRSCGTASRRFSASHAVQYAPIPPSRSSS